jgi:hypothetical protein
MDYSEPDEATYNDNVFVQDVDYYIDENGNTVFTEAFLLNRGTCCNNNCKHCPY